MALNGTIGQPARFEDGFIFKEETLPNAATKSSGEWTLNNTLGGLQLTAEIDNNLTLSGSQNLSVILQYKDDAGAWKTTAPIFSATNTTLQGGLLFKYIPAPDNDKRVYRLQIMSDFNASAVKFTCAIDLMS